MLRPAVSPGKYGRLPWLHQLDLGATWRPGWGGQKLAFSGNIFNVLNEQRSTFDQPNSVISGTTPNWLYGTPVYREAPRYVRLSVNYDF